MQFARAGLAAIGSGVRSVVRAFGPSEPASSKPWTLEAIVPQAPPAFASMSLSHAANIVEEHELGQFTNSAMLADLLLRNPDVQQALGQRVLAAIGLPFELRPADDSASAARHQRELLPLWHRMVTRAALCEMYAWAVLLGFAIAQVKWVWDESTGQYLATLVPWHPAYCWYDTTQGKWFVSTSNGVVEVVPGDGRWVLYAPRSVLRPHAFGVIRCLPPSYLSALYSLRDANRFGEVHGQGVWLPKMPAGWNKTEDGKAFVSAVRNMGRSGIVPVPRGATEETSYDLSLLEAKGRGHEVFEYLDRTSAAKIRLAILGQDMTSQSGPRGGSFAQSKVGNSVRQDVTEFDVESMGETLQAQHGRNVAVYLRGNADLAARPSWNATPPPDLAQLAEAQKTAADGLVVWTEQLADADEVPDSVAYARAFGLPLRKNDTKKPTKGDGANNA